MRARQVPCSDELIDGGEGRAGDWLLENAHARYVVRGTYAALTRLDEGGGTLIDAAVPGGQDVLLEYLPDADRSAIEAWNGDSEAALVLPGVTYRLYADDPALYLEGADTGSLQGIVGSVRTGATVATDTGFFGLDGTPHGSGGAVRVEGATRASVTAEGVWPDGDDVAAEVDADAVVAALDGAPRVRLPVLDGRVTGRVPAGAALVAEREGCVYAGLTLSACGSLHVRVADEAGVDLVAVLTDGTRSFPVPRGGGTLAIGPEPGRWWLWAGPTHAAAELWFPGGDAEAAATLAQEVDDAGVVLAALAVEVAPDADTERTAEQAATALAAEGVAFAVMLADDEVPTTSVGLFDPLLAVAASRAGGAVWSWTWSANGKRPAHGAVRWSGLGALDLLAVTEGGQSAARITVVTPEWVAAARAEAAPVDWSPRPDAVWLPDLGGLDAYLALVDGWLDVAPVGPRTWIGVDSDRNIAAYEAGIVQVRTTAGTGPRLDVTLLDRDAAELELAVRLGAPRWMGMHTIHLHTALGVVTRRVEGPGTWKWTVPAGADWVVAVAEGEHATPGSDEPAWAVSAPLRLARP